MFSQKHAIKQASGKVQLAAGQSGGCEAAVHALCDRFSDEDCQAVMLLDASNAFNRLNRALVLQNMEHICPEMEVVFGNLYGNPSPLYVGSHVLLSDEGSTQGCPSAMAMYSLGILPLINLADMDDIIQCWYADDANAAGNLTGLLDWFSLVQTQGPAFGYYVNPEKCNLIVKEEHLEEAQELFKDVGVKITSAGARHLGAAIGMESYRAEYVSGKVSEWAAALENLVDIARKNPHIAYSNFIRSFKCKWGYLQRTIPDIGPLFQPIEDIIRHKFIPLVVGKHVSDLERRVLALPIRMGGMAIEDPTKAANHQYSSSRFINTPLVELILGSENGNIADAESCAAKNKKECEEAATERDELELKSIVSEADDRLKRALELNSEQGASSWLSARPLKHLDHELNQREFIDAIRLRYCFHFPDLPSKCGCGAQNNADHALICKVGGFDIWRHDHLRDTMAELLRYAGFKPVNTEQQLLPCDGHTLPVSSNTMADARMDIVCRGLWRDMEASYLDVRVFHPNSPSYQKTSIAQLHRTHQNQKKIAYLRRVLNVEQGSFTPLVFATSGGFAPEVKRVLDCVGHKICSKHQEVLSETMSFMRQKLRFSLLRSTLVALRGTKRRVVPFSASEIDFTRI